MIPSNLRPRHIVAKEKLTEARKLYPENCKPGKIYTVGYRKHQFDAKFVEWVLQDGLPRMMWTEVTNDDPKISKWEAYMFEGKMSIGSSADPLIIYTENK